MKELTLVIKNEGVFLRECWIDINRIISIEKSDRKEFFIYLDTGDRWNLDIRCYKNLLKTWQSCKPKKYITKVYKQ